MLEKIKGLKNRRDQALAKVDDLKSQKKPAIAKLLEAEDTGKPPEKHRVNLEKVKTQIEIGAAAVDKRDAELKAALSNFIDLQIKNYHKEKIDLENQRADVLRLAGESIGRATVILQTLGPPGHEVGSALLSVLRRYSDICSPIIEARANYLNSADEAEKLTAMKTLHMRLKPIVQNPHEKNRLVDKYFFATIKGSYDFLVGL